MPADREPLVELDEIARLLESHEGPPAHGQRPHPPRSGLRRTGAAAVGALAVGSALGFGLGSSLTEPETARANLLGTGFLPARGWSVVQSGKLDAEGASRAIAANVPIAVEDDGHDLPFATLASLPARGIVIVATFTTRGDAGADVAYPVRALPLRMSDAVEAASGEYRLRAGVRGTNVDVRVFIGQPASRMRAAAQGQLSRLSVASDRVTIFARPSIAGSDPVTIFGSIDNGRAGETVTIQAKDCGSSFFRAFAGAETRDGGGWSTVIYPRITTTLRAVWGDAASAQITIRQRAVPWLSKRRSGDEYYVAIGAKRSFWRKKVFIQRRAGNRWVAVKTVELTETGALRGTGGGGAAAEFRVTVPKGTLIRAVLPRSQAKPCYLPGVSRTLRT